MHRTVLAIGLVFLLLGLFFASGGGLMVGSTFLSLGLPLLVLGYVLGGNDDAGPDPDGATE